MEVLAIVTLSIILAVFIGTVVEVVVKRIKVHKAEQRLEDAAFADLMDCIVTTVSTHDDSIKEINDDIEDLKHTVDALTMALAAMATEKSKKDEKKKK